MARKALCTTPLSVYNGKNDKIHFGGTNGYTVIHKNKLSQNNFKPKAFITNFAVDAEPHPLPNIYNKEDVINLKYDQSSIELRFSSDNYLVPENNKFKYRLKGYDDDWTYVDAFARHASYSKLPAGNYVFQLIASNNDGVWGDIATEFRIKKTVAPWFSWTAYLVYTLLMGGVFFAFYRNYVERKEMRIQLYIDNIEKNKQKEIHESQLRFFTNISHDFRTPLSLIIGSVEKLRKQGMKESDFRVLNSNANRLLNLVNELMDFRAIENGKMNLEVEEIDVNSFIAELSSSFTVHAVQHNIEFQVIADKSLPRLIAVDKYVLEKIIMNLLNNAFKYTKDGGSVILKTYVNNTLFESKYKHHFKVDSTLEIADCFGIAVSDTGVGISSESIHSVFERFFKVKTVNFDYHLGTGIGLALVKSLTLLHKGTITIFSERYKGTDMLVSLPLKSSVYIESEIKTMDQEEDKKDVVIEKEKEKYDLPDEETEGLVEKNKYLVLLVEDNDDLRHLMAGQLEEDYHIIEASNGVEASKIIQKRNIDLIISDIMMPLKDGITLCKEVKADEETSHIPFIIFSAKTSTDSKIEGADSGADLYFEKPLDIELLKVSIENIFTQRESLKEHFSKNYFVDNTELSTNSMDKEFLRKLINVLDDNLDESSFDVNSLATNMLMSRSKLYNKVKALTGKSIVEFILNYRMRKAARLIIETNLTMREVMIRIGIESQPYFTNAFKKEFGDTPTQFAAKNKKA